MARAAYFPQIKRLVTSPRFFPSRATGGTLRGDTEAYRVGCPIGNLLNLVIVLHGHLGLNRLVTAFFKDSRQIVVALKLLF